MEEIKNIIAYVCSLIGTVVSYISSWGTPIEILFPLLMVDSLFLFMKGEPDFCYIPKKMIMIIAIIYTSWLIASATENGAIYCAVCWYYIAIAGLSIIESAYLLGLPIPKKIENLLLDIKEGK